MRQFKAAVGLAGLLTLLAPTFGARASILFDNTGQTAFGADALSNTLYASFSTGSQSTLLGPVSLSMFATAPTDGGTVYAVLLSDASNTPGGQLGLIGKVTDSALGVVFPPAAPTNVTLSSSLSLNANTRYWIELTGVGSSAYWDFTNNGNGTGVSAQFNENGSNGTGPTPNSTSGSVYIMSVSTAAADPIPEAPSVTIIGAGLLGLLLVRRSKPKGA